MIAFWWNKCEGKKWWCRKLLSCYLSAPGQTWQNCQVRKFSDLAKLPSQKIFWPGKIAVSENLYWCSTFTMSEILTCHPITRQELFIYLFLTYIFHFLHMSEIFFLRVKTPKHVRNGWWGKNKFFVVKEIFFALNMLGNGCLLLNISTF